MHNFDGDESHANVRRGREFKMQNSVVGWRSGTCKFKTEWKEEKY